MLLTHVPAQISVQSTKELAAWISDPETPLVAPTASQVVAEEGEYHLQAGLAVSVVEAVTRGTVVGVVDVDTVDVDVDEDEDEDED
jgi:hypothetical protein